MLDQHEKSKQLGITRSIYLIPFRSTSSHCGFTRAQEVCTISVNHLQKFFLVAIVLGEKRSRFYFISSSFFRPIIYVLHHDAPPGLGLSGLPFVPLESFLEEEILCNCMNRMYIVFVYGKRSFLYAELDQRA